MSHSINNYDYLCNQITNLQTSVESLARNPSRISQEEVENVNHIFHVLLLSSQKLACTPGQSEIIEKMLSAVSTTIIQLRTTTSRSSSFLCDHSKFSALALAYKNDDKAYAQELYSTLDKDTKNKLHGNVWQIARMPNVDEFGKKAFEQGRATNKQLSIAVEMLNSPVCILQSLQTLIKNGKGNEALRIKKQMPECLQQILHGKTWQACGSPKDSHCDYGRVAFNGEEGFNATVAQKIEALDLAIREVAIAEETSNEAILTMLLKYNFIDLSNEAGPAKHSTKKAEIENCLEKILRAFGIVPSFQKENSITKTLTNALSAHPILNNFAALLSIVREVQDSNYSLPQPATAASSASAASTSTNPWLPTPHKVHAVAQRPVAVAAAEQASSPAIANPSVLRAAVPQPFPASQATAREVERTQAASQRGQVSASPKLILNQDLSRELENAKKLGVAPDLIASIIMADAKINELANLSNLSYTRLSGADTHTIDTLFFALSNEIQEIETFIEGLKSTSHLKKAATNLEGRVRQDLYNALRSICAKSVEMTIKNDAALSQSLRSLTAEQIFSARKKLHLENLNFVNKHPMLDPDHKDLCIVSYNSTIRTHLHSHLEVPIPVGAELLIEAALVEQKALSLASGDYLAIARTLPSYQRDLLLLQNAGLEEKIRELEVATMPNLQFNKEFRSKIANAKAQLDTVKANTKRGYEISAQGTLENDRKIANAIVSIESLLGPDVAASLKKSRIALAESNAPYSQVTSDNLALIKKMFQ